MRHIERLLLALLLLAVLAGTAQALKLLRYDAITLNGGSANQTLSLDEHYPDTRLIFSYEAGTDMTATPMTVYYELLDSEDWISAGSPDLNGTTESDLVIDIGSVGVTGIKLVGNATGTVKPVQYEEGVNKAHWD